MFFWGDVGVVVLRASEGCVQETGFFCTGGRGLVFSSEVSVLSPGQKETKPRGQRDKASGFLCRRPRSCARSFWPWLFEVCFLFSFFFFSLFDVRAVFWIFGVGACVLRANEGCAGDGFCAQVVLFLSPPSSSGFGSFSLDRKRRNLVDRRMRRSLVLLLEKGLASCAHFLAFRGFFFLFFFFVWCTYSVLDLGCWGLGLCVAGEQRMC